MVLADVLRSGETAKLIEIENNESSDGERNRASLDPNDEPACFQGVDRALNEFFATGHLMRVRSWLALFPWRSFH